MRRPQEVFSAKTGTGTSTEVTRKQLRIQHASQPILAKLAITYGTTITVQLQGKQIMKTTWETIGEDTYVTEDGSPQYLRSAHATKKRFEKYRLNITVNTNCTITAHIGIGDVED